MTSSPSPLIVDEAEALVRAFATAIARPRRGECVACYIGRNIVEFGCDHTHRFALRYRDTVASRTTTLLERLSALGGWCCDCELFLNGLWLRPEYLPPRDDGTADADTRDDDPRDDDEVQLIPVGGCAGVRRGSIRPCDAWMRAPRGM